MRLYVSEVVKSWPVSHDRLDEIREATEKDPVMQQAVKFTVEGWPDRTDGITGDQTCQLVRSCYFIMEELLSLRPYRFARFDFNSSQ